MKNKIIKLIQEALNKLNIEYDNVIIDNPKNDINGDYSCNIALQLTKILHKNPMDIALEIVKNINDKEFDHIEVVKPGFINFYLSKEELYNNLNNILQNPKEYGKNNIGNNKKINIEFVSANPTGTLHLGNARGGAYGDSLARIMSFSGYNVTKEYYVNDAGNQVDNLALSIQARYFEICGQKKELPENGYHGQEIIDLAQNIYDENKDSLIAKPLEYYKTIGIEYLLSKIKEDLHNYRIDFDKFTSEKEIRNKYNLDNIIDIMNKNGYVYELDGAKWFSCSKIFDDKDHVLVKKDGTYTYFVPDIAYHLDKYNRGYDKMIDVLGTDHHGYVARLKSSVKAVGNDPDKLEIKLLQLVKLVEGDKVVKMSKRTGDIVSLKELIDEVGINAARYYFSKYSLDTQMDFDLQLAKEKSNNNPVFYVSYAYARICSILKENNIEYNGKEYTKLNDETAIKLLKKIYMFPEEVANAALKELPHLITNYVYELATLFHSYYDSVQIISDDEIKTKENINLIKGVQSTIYNALNLIGVIPPERM